jgi:hypothetical protein
VPEIQRVSHTHNAIMDYMLANPGVNLGSIAAHFGYTQPWLSCIIHSDAFQSLLKDRQDTIFHHTVMPIREKMLGVASQALDRIAERIPIETDLGVLTKTASTVLDRLGFGTQQAAVVINNTVNNTQVNTLRSELNDARALMGKIERPQIGVTIDESGKQPVLALPDPNASSVGEVDTGKGLTLSPTRMQGATAEKGEGA